MSSSSGRSAMFPPVWWLADPTPPLDGAPGGRRGRPRRVHPAETRHRQGLSYSPDILTDVDPFIGTAATTCLAPRGLAATWWWPKPQVGNTHPGATSPSAWSPPAPTPARTRPGTAATTRTPRASRRDVRADGLGFTHFQQSGTGAIRKYYNYFRVTPMVSRWTTSARRGRCTTRSPSPGYYAATLDSGIRCEITVGPKIAVHRYTFPEHRNARLVIDFSSAAWPSRTAVPCRCAPTSRAWAAASPRANRRRRALRSRSTSEVDARAGGRCSGTTAGSCRAAPGSTSTASGRPPCARSG